MSEKEPWVHLWWEEGGDNWKMHFYQAQLHLSVNNQHTALHLGITSLWATVLFGSSQLLTANKIKGEYLDPSNLCSVGDLKYSKPIKLKFTDMWLQCVTRIKHCFWLNKHNFRASSCSLIVTSATLTVYGSSLFAIVTIVQSNNSPLLTFILHGGTIWFWLHSLMINIQSSSTSGMILTLQFLNVGINNNIYLQSIRQIINFLSPTRHLCV